MSCYWCGGNSCGCFEAAQVDEMRKALSRQDTLKELQKDAQEMGYYEAIGADSEQEIEELRLRAQVKYVASKAVKQRERREFCKDYIIHNEARPYHALATWDDLDKQLSELEKKESEGE